MEASVNANKFMEQEKIGRLMRKFAVPCVMSLVIAALYNIVDQVFVGWGVGYLGNGATNVVFPLTVVALAVAVMIGDSACAFVSISLGKNDADNAGKSVGNAIVLTVLASIVLTAMYLVFQEPILRAFGATENNLPYAKEYFTTITLGIPFYMFGNAMNPIIRSDGSPRFAMVSTLIGAVLNIILDPIAIFGLGWGMMGAALATVIGQVVTAVLAVWYLLRMKAVRLRKPCFRLSGRLIGRFLPLGLSSFLSQVSMVLAMAATNNMLVKYGAMTEYGADIPLTVLGIVMKVFQMIISITIGMAAGCIPIVGYNVGAGRNDRVRGILKRLMAAEVVLGLASLVLVQFFPRQIIGVFGSESELYNQFAVLTFRIYLSMVLLACVNKATFIFQQAMGKPFVSTMLSLLREVVLGVPLVLILPRFFGLDGILYSMPLSDIIAFVASAIVLARTWRGLRDKPAHTAASHAQEETPAGLAV